MNDASAAGTISGLALLAAVAFVAAAVNSVAGGGTILTFPVLAAILPPDPGRLVTANATSTLGLWPGAVAAAWAYRGERVGQPLWARWLVLPSVAGAVIGAVLVLVLPPRWFDACVPWLILLAAVLFTVQPWLARRLGRPAGTPAAEDIGDVLEYADSNEQCRVATVSRSYRKAAGTDAGGVTDSLVGVREGPITHRADAARDGALACP